MAIPGITGSLGAGAGGSLGTLFVRLTADSSGLEKGMAAATRSVTGGSVAIAKGLLVITAAIVGVGVAAVREFALFESSFAGVRKTVDASEKEFAALSKQFRKMATELPIGINEINKIAEAAGQLGVAKEDIAAFTKVIIDLGVSTNIKGEEGASALAKFANVAKVSTKDFDRLGSVIVGLGNSGASTEKDILEMGQRIAAAGVQVGFTYDQTLALANALSSIGLEAEAGGTAMSQTMAKMSKAVKTGNEDLKQFADVAGMTNEVFVDLFQKDSAQAIFEFFKGLDGIRKVGGDVFTLLENMNIDGTRLTNMMLGAATAEDQFRKSLELGAKLKKENIALTNESNERYKTFISRITVTKNMLVELLITIGEGLTPGLTDLNTSLQNGLKWMNSYGDSIKEISGRVVPAFLLGLGYIKFGLQSLLIVWKTQELAVLGLANIISQVAQDAITLFNFTKKFNPAMMFSPDIDSTKVDRAVERTGEAFRKTAEELKALGTSASITAIQLMLDWEKAFGELNTTIAENGNTYAAEVKKVQELSDAYNKLIPKVNELAAAEKTRAMNSLKVVSSQNMNTALDAMGAPKGMDVLGKKQVGLSKTEMNLAVAGVGGMSDPATMQALNIQRELELSEDRLKELKILADKEVNLDADTQMRKMQTLELYNRQIKQLHMAQAQIVLGSASDMFGDLGTIAEAWAGKQSGVYKTMFAVSKAFAIANASIQIATGIANAAAAQPWFMAIPAMASVIAATASIVSNISAVQLEFGGKRALGGPVSTGRAFLVGERGPEMFVPKANGSIVPNNQLSGGGTTLIINNHTDAKPEVTERQEGDHRIVEVLIRRVKNEIGSEIRDGTGVIPKAMESTFNLRRGR